jgi:hypothetical protein
MKKNVMIGAMAAFALPLAALAQEAEAPKPYVYATYHYCDSGAQEEIDGIVDRVWAPIYDKAVEDGELVGWGWYAHHTGGKWRRLSYYMSPTLDGLFTAQESIGKKLDDAMGDERAFGKACRMHDDYIWQITAGSNIDDGPQGKVGMSVYMQCKMSSEERADELVTTVYAPIYNSFIGDGKARSWGWLTHVVGGKYRRALTLTADDVPTLLKTRADIIGAIQAKNLGSEFSDICYSHTDYIWDIQH